MQKELTSPWVAWMQLTVVILVICLTWLVVLPHVGEIHPIRERNEKLRAAKVETDAMFYTELNWTPPAGAYFR